MIVEVGDTVKLEPLADEPNNAPPLAAEYQFIVLPTEVALMDAVSLKQIAAGIALDAEIVGTGFTVIVELPDVVEGHEVASDNMPIE